MNINIYNIPKGFKAISISFDNYSSTTIVKEDVDIEDFTKQVINTEVGKYANNRNGEFVGIFTRYFLTEKLLEKAKVEVFKPKI